MKALALQAKERMAAGDKRKAVNLMKQRKLYEVEQTKISNVKLTLETQVINLEGSAHTADAFRAMKGGARKMKKIRKHMGGIDNVDNLVMDIQEELDMANEVNNAIGQSVDPLLGTIDDDDLLRELDMYETNELRTKFNKADGGAKSTKKSIWSLPSLSRQEEKDLNRLEAELMAA